MHTSLFTGAARAAVLAGLAAAAGCSTYPVEVREGRVYHLPLTYEKSPTSSVPERVAGPANPEALSVRFLGTTCCLLTRGDAAIFLDPYFTHRHPLQSAFGKLKPDRALIAETVDRRLNPALARAAQVDVFVSHAHYDHIGGLVPCLDAGLKGPVHIYGSQTTAYLLAGYNIERTNVTVNVVTPTHVTTNWIPVKTTGRVKVDYRAHENVHPPHIGPYLFGEGRLTKPLSKPPERLCEFKLGASYAYEFRFRTENATERVFLTTSASLPMLPRAQWPDPEPDLFLLGISLWEHSPDKHGYPGRLLNHLNPKQIALVHWNNFFAPRDADPTPFVGTGSAFEPLFKSIGTSWPRHRDDIGAPDAYVILPGLNSDFSLSD